MIFLTAIAAFYVGGVASWVTCVNLATGEDSLPDPERESDVWMAMGWPVFAAVIVVEWVLRKVEK